MAERLVRLCREHGGHLGHNDLDQYRLIRREPLRHSYRGYQVAANPIPSSGGTLISFALAALGNQDIVSAGFGSTRHLWTLAEVMAHTDLARQDGLLARSERHSELMAAHLAALAGHPVNNRGTTHISAIDAQGNSASITLSNGEGSGLLLPATGIMLNNMLGEEDLNPEGFNRWSENVRVSSMMAPTLAQDHRRLIAIGSGGSNRLRTAILQTLSNLIDFGMTPEHAVNAARIHLERGRLDIEPGLPEDAVAVLGRHYTDHQVWESHNLFFGGTHTVCWDGKTFTGAGDPRRGGIFLRSP
jgi:gamma-glutamyltranspeptidase/glutathione hydrolase